MLLGFFEFLGLLLCRNLQLYRFTFEGCPHQKEPRHCHTAKRYGGNDGLDAIYGQTKLAGPTIHGEDCGGRSSCPHRPGAIDLAIALRTPAHLPQQQRGQY